MKLFSLLLPLCWLHSVVEAIRCHQKYQYYSKSEQVWKDYPQANKYFNVTVGETCETDGYCVTAIIASIDDNLRGLPRPETDLRVTLQTCCPLNRPCATARLHSLMDTGRIAQRRNCTVRNGATTTDYVLDCGSLIPRKRRHGKIALFKCDHADFCELEREELNWEPDSCLLNDDWSDIEQCEVIHHNPPQRYRYRYY